MADERPPLSIFPRINCLETTNKKLGAHRDAPPVEGLLAHARRCATAARRIAKTTAQLVSVTSRTSVDREQASG